MINTRSTLFVTLMLLMLALTSCTTQGAQATDTQLTGEEQVTVNAIVNKHIQYLGGSSIVALASGLLLKNDALLGLGIGGTIGTACYIIEDKTLWPISWIIAYFARTSLVDKLHTTKPDDVALTPDQMVGIGIITHIIVPHNASEEILKQNEAGLAYMVKSNSTAISATNCSTIGTWATYIWLRYVERYAKQHTK